MEIHKTDIIVLGSGLAGLSAAISAAEHNKNLKIAILAKSYLTRPHSVRGEHIAAVFSTEDSFDRHAYDLIRIGDFLSDQDAVEFAVRKAPEVIIKLDNWGAPFERAPDGKYKIVFVPPNSAPRDIFIEDKYGLLITGIVVINILYDRLSLYNNIEKFPEYFATSIIAKNGIFQGLTAINMKNGEFIVFRSKAIIIATGGIARLYTHTAFSQQVTGDGIAMALRVGLPVKDPEFVQFQPVVSVPSSLVLDPLDAYPGGLINKEGESFMKRYDPINMEKAPSQVIARAIRWEIQAGRAFDGPWGPYVLMNYRHLSKEEVKGHISGERKRLKKLQGIDLLNEPVPVRPGAHYYMGGIHVNLNTETPIKGIYASGEASCISIHGAVRVFGNATMDCLVFGEISGENAAKYAEKANLADLDMDMVKKEEIRIYVESFKRKGEGVASITKDLQSTMEEKVGVLRNEKDLTDALKIIKQLKERFKNAYVEDKNTKYNTNLFSYLELSYMPVTDTKWHP